MIAAIRIRYKSCTRNLRRQELSVLDRHHIALTVQHQSRCPNRRENSPHIDLNVVPSRHLESAWAECQALQFSVMPSATRLVCVAGEEVVVRYASTPAVRPQATYAIHYLIS